MVFHESNSSKGKTTRSSVPALERGRKHRAVLNAERNRHRKSDFRHSPTLVCFCGNGEMTNETSLRRTRWPPAQGTIRSDRREKQGKETCAKYAERRACAARFTAEPTGTRMQSCRLQVAGCRLQVAGCRLQVAGTLYHNPLICQGISWRTVRWGTAFRLDLVQGRHDDDHGVIRQPHL
jgi:hypothetical protein